MRQASHKLLEKAEFIDMIGKMEREKESVGLRD